MRPPGRVRLALLAALQAGAVGTFDALARHAGVPEHQARQTLGNLRREGVISACRPAACAASPGAAAQRLRAVYAPASNAPHFDVAAYVRQAWR